MSDTIPISCLDAQALLDAWLDVRDEPPPGDGSLSAGEFAHVARHLSECGQCAEIAANRSALRNRLRTAAKDIAAPAGLERRVRRQLWPETSPGSHRTWMALAFAALLLFGVGLTRSWQSGGLRFTVGSQDDYIASLTPQVAPVMRIGLREHVHCAIFGQHPKPLPALDSMLRDLGPAYADLGTVFGKHLQANDVLVEAHRCCYRGRNYIHFLVSGDQGPISLLITDIKPGEGFENDLHAIAAEGGTPLYVSAVQRFSMAGMQTRDHLVYLVSERGTRRNLEAFQTIASDVALAVRRTEL